VGVLADAPAEGTNATPASAMTPMPAVSQPSFLNMIPIPFSLVRRMSLRSLRRVSGRKAAASLPERSLRAKSA
jgi:hypothetical protein